MPQMNDVVRAVLGAIPVEALRSEEQRQAFLRIRSRLDQVLDTEAELKNLYKVRGFSEFAAALMWIVQRIQRNPAAGGGQQGDEELLVSAFSSAFGDSVQESPATPAPPVSDGAGDDKDFASRLERLSEAVQSGSEGRGALLENLLTVCDAFVNTTSDDQFKEFCGLLGELLKYVATNELLDDVRVINILSNVSSTVLQWAASPPANRPGLIEEAAGMMRDFKSHFE